VAHLVSPSTAALREERNCAPPSAIRVKNRRKTSEQYWREIRRNKPTWKRWTNCWQMA